MWRSGYLQGRLDTIFERGRPDVMTPGPARQAISMFLTAIRLVIVALLVWLLVHAAMHVGYLRAMHDIRRSIEPQDSSHGSILAHGKPVHLTLDISRAIMAH